MPLAERLCALEGCYNIARAYQRSHGAYLTLDGYEYTAQECRSRWQVLGSPPA
jgi:hypothetical protein